MKVGIKDLAVSMEVKNNGVEFEVYDNADKFLGDLAGCGKTRVEGDRCAPTPLTRAVDAHP